MSETEKRIELANRLVTENKHLSVGIVLAGSVAYAPHHMVTKKSDLDLIIVANNLKDFIEPFVADKKDRKNLYNRFFDGYCFKKIIDDIPVSFHILSPDAFEIITKSFVADIRVFRAQSKDEDYILYGFERNEYKYVIKYNPLEEFETGVRTIVPVGFINKDRYYLGIHRDKLLCNPLILHDTAGTISNGIDKLWNIMCQNLCDEAMRLHGTVDKSKMNILNMLAKRDKIVDPIKDIIVDTTEQYLQLCMKNRKA